MAKKGCKYLVYAPISAETAGSRPTYGTGGVLAKLTKYETSMNMSNVKMYADDVVCEVADNFTDGTITVGCDYLSPTNRVAVLGDTSATVSTQLEYTEAAEDEAPYVGTGFIISMQVNNENKYRAIWFLRVKYKKTSDSGETKGQSTTFGEETLTGEITVVEGYKNNAYKEYAEFDTFSAAQTWLKGKANIT